MSYDRQKHHLFQTTCKLLGMMYKKVFKVVDDFNSDNDYGVYIYSQQVKCLSVLKKGQVTTQKEFLEKHSNELTVKFSEQPVIQRLIITSFGIGVKIGVLKKVNNSPITFLDFCKLETVSYFREQLRHSKFKNVEREGMVDLLNFLFRDPTEK